MTTARSSRSAAPQTRDPQRHAGRRPQGQGHHPLGIRRARHRRRLYLYDNLFTLENVNDVPEGTDYLDYLNPDSLKKLTGCKLEPSLADAKEGERF